ncbi:MAG: AAA family ATPase [Chlorobiaceae bacterium]|nr:AAA family ATPase [Chlorobiaceae bacterium]
MLINHTITKLSDLKLCGMAQAVTAQLNQTEIQSISFEERLAMVVDAEFSYRETKKMKKLLSNAKFAIPSATIENIDFDPSRKLDRPLISTLITCNWVEKKQNVIVEGPSGAGKSWFACALGNQICRNGTSVRYIKMSRLVEEIKIAIGDGSIKRYRAQFARIKVLIIDDWLLAPMETVSAREILEILDDCYNIGSLILTSQHPVSDWHSRIAEKTVADAILDRIVHNSHRIKISGESMRKKKNSVTYS